MHRLHRPVAVLALAALGACAAQTKRSGDDPTDTFGPTGGGSGGGAFLDGDGGPSDARAQRPLRCDDAGQCTCFNIASLGRPGHTGFQGGQDSTTAFTDYLNEESSAHVDLVTARPKLTAEFLAQYDVLILQWLVDGVSGGNGSGYWTFGADETAALAAWVEAGGGLIALSGYDASSQEVTPVNQLLSAVSDITYGTADVLGSQSNYCLGDSQPLGGWVQSTPLGAHVNEVGVFHGRPLMAGAKAVVDCADGSSVYAAHEDVGKGHVFVFTDEWVTYTSQWFGIDAGTSCSGMSAGAVYQVPQFWFNAIRYVSGATACTFDLAGPITR